MGDDRTYSMLCATRNPRMTLPRWDGRRFEPHTFHRTTRIVLAETVPVEPGVDLLIPFQHKPREGTP
jgi:hypothetical protein